MLTESFNARNVIINKYCFLCVIIGVTFFKKNNRNKLFITCLKRPIWLQEWTENVSDDVVVITTDSWCNSE